jgi:hypothetical protein
MLHRILISLLFAAVVAAGAAPAEAGHRKVFFNGVDLENVDVSPQTFKSCTVEFDKDGNVHVTAPGLKVKKRKAKDKAERRSASDEPSLTKRYFIANRGTASAKAQFDVTVYVNGARARTVRAGDPDGVVEVTKLLEPGENQVKIVASKNLGKSGKRRSQSAQDTIEIVLGEGTVSKGVVTMTTTVQRYERNASETGTFTDRYPFATR